MARPLKKIDKDELEKLAMMQCTTEEIAAWFNVSVDTIDRRFAESIKKGRAKGRMSMKRQLFAKVQHGDLGALVWWGKNFAGMSDRQEVNNHTTLNLTEQQANIVGTLAEKSAAFLGKKK